MKKKSYRIMTALLAIIMSLGMLVGCSGTEEETENITTAAVTQEADDEVQEAEDSVEEDIERLQQPWAEPVFYLDGNKVSANKDGDVYTLEAFVGQELKVEMELHNDVQEVDGIWNKLLSDNEEIASPVIDDAFARLLNPGNVVLTVVYGDEAGFSEHEIFVECCVSEVVAVIDENTAGRILGDLNDDGRILITSDDKIIITGFNDNTNVMYDTLDNMVNSVGHKVKSENFVKLGIPNNLNEYKGEVYYTGEGEIRKMNSDLSGYTTVYADGELYFDKLFFTLGDDFFCYGDINDAFKSGHFVKLAPDGTIKAKTDLMIEASKFAYDNGKIYFTAKTSRAKDAQSSDYYIDLATMTVEQLGTNYLAQKRNHTISNGIMHCIDSHYNTYDVIDLEKGEVVSSVKTPMTYCDAGFYNGCMYFLMYQDKTDGKAILATYNDETEKFEALSSWNFGNCRGVPHLYYADGKLYTRAESVNNDQLHYLVYDVTNEKEMFWD